MEEKVQEILTKKKEEEIKKFLEGEEPDENKNKKERDNMSKDNESEKDEKDKKKEPEASPEFKEEFKRMQDENKEHRVRAKLMELRSGKGLNFNIDDEVKIMGKLPEDMHEMYMKKLDIENEKIPVDKESIEPPDEDEKKKSKDEDVGDDKFFRTADEKEYFSNIQLEREFIEAGDQIQGFNLPHHMKDVQTVDIK